MRTGSFDDVIDCGGGVYNVSGQRTMSVSIQVYGNTQVTSGEAAYQLVADLSASLTKPSVLQILSSQGIAVYHIGDVSDISAVEESEYEERAQFDIRIGVAENVEDQLGCIETTQLILNVLGLSLIHI